MEYFINGKYNKLVENFQKLMKEHGLNDVEITLYVYRYKIYIEYSNYDGNIRTESINLNDISSRPNLKDELVKIIMKNIKYKLYKDISKGLGDDNENKTI